MLRFILALALASVGFAQDVCNPVYPGHPPFLVECPAESVLDFACIGNAKAAHEADWLAEVVPLYDVACALDAGIAQLEADMEETQDEIDYYMDWMIYLKIGCIANVPNACDLLQQAREQVEMLDLQMLGMTMQRSVYQHERLTAMAVANIRQGEIRDIFLDAVALCCTSSSAHVPQNLPAMTTLCIR